jgi:hypothetical protein
MEMKGMGVEGAVTVGGVGKRWWIRRERERI